MNIEQLQALVINALEDMKAQDTQLFDTMHLTALFDRLVIVSGTSNRHTKALAASVRDKVRTAGENVLSVEGEQTGEWVIVDTGGIVVHIMQSAIRAYYRLEELWGDRPISLESARVFKPASDSGVSASRKRVAAKIKEPVVKIPALKKPVAKKTTAKTADKVADKVANTAASSPLAKKTAVKKTIATVSVKKVVNKIVAKKVPAVKTVAVKVARKTSVAKVAAPKTKRTVKLT